MSKEQVHNKIQIVDEYDNILGSKWYDDALREGCIRRASRMFVINESGKVLIQRRSEYISNPLLLDNSAAGHVEEGETYYEAALRELEEELGLSGYELQEIVSSYRTPQFFITLYRLVIPDSVKITFDQHEIKEVLWLTPREIDQLLIDKPNECKDSLTDLWKEFKDKLIQ